MDLLEGKNKIKNKKGVSEMTDQSSETLWEGKVDVKLPCVEMEWQHEAGEFIGDEVYDVAKNCWASYNIYIYTILVVLLFF